MDNIDLARPRTRRRFFFKLLVGLLILVIGAYLTISYFGNTGAKEATLDADIQSDLSIAPNDQSILAPGASSISSAPGTASSSHSYASPSEINDVVPMNGQSTEMFKQSDVLEFLDHEVRPGENLWSIARRYQRSIHTIVSVNQDKLGGKSYLPKGAKLRIPNRDGILTTLKPGQTLWDLMKSYDVDYRKILSFNEISSASRVRTGQELFIPGARPLNPYKFKPSNQSSSKFLWPVSPRKRRITSGFGDRFHPVLKEEIFHRGVDIGGGRGTAVFASRAGDVVYSNRYGDYGNTVVIDHGNGYRTLYAHLSRDVVQKNQYVEKGQPIAFIGSSGLATGANLHFEVRKDKKALDPIDFLPNT